MMNLKQNNKRKPVRIYLLALGIIWSCAAAEEPSAPAPTEGTQPSQPAERPAQTAAVPDEQATQTEQAQPVVERTWFEQALSEEKPRDYLYRLLDDVTPTEFEQSITAASIATPALDRAQVLEAKHQKRLSALQAMTTLSTEQQQQILTELQQAKGLLLAKDQADYYALLGHALYAFITNNQPFLLIEFKDKPALSILRMLIFFLQSTAAGKGPDDALALTKAADLAGQVLEVPEAEKPLLLALGKTLFQTLKPAHKQLLLTLVQSQPPTNPTEPDEPYLQKIATKYLELVFCELQGQAYKPKEKEGEGEIVTPGQPKRPKVPTGKTEEEKTPEEIPAPALDNKKVAGALEKAIEKLQPALHSLRQISSSAKGSDRTAARGIIDRALKANGTLKTVADRITAKYKEGGAPAQEFSTYVQIVQEMYSLANSM